MSRARGRRAAPVVVVYYPDPREVERYARLVRAPRGAVRLHVCADAASAAAVAEDAEVLFAWKFPPPLYARARRLRWVQAMGAGVDWALPDVPAGVTITRVPGVFGPWMAEYVAGELALNAAEVSDARWLAVDEICRLDGTFEGDRDFYRKILPSLVS